MRTVHTRGVVGSNPSLATTVKERVCVLFLCNFITKIVVSLCSICGLIMKCAQAKYVIIVNIGEIT